MRLHIGVIDYKYTENAKSVSTGDIAQILEKRYAVMTGFVVSHIQDIANDMAESYAGALDSMMMGSPSGNPADQAMSSISGRAKEYLSSQDAETVLSPGSKGFPVPTEAALMGVRHRYKDPTSILKKVMSGKKTKVGIRRPSFIDTGMYQNSLIAWTEE